MRGGRLVAIVSKIGDDLIFAGGPSTTYHTILEISARVELRTIVHGPGHPRFFGLNMYQDEKYTTTVGGDYKQDGIAATQIFRIRFRDLYLLLTSF